MSSGGEPEMQPSATSAAVPQKSTAAHASATKALSAQTPNEGGSRGVDAPPNRTPSHSELAQRILGIQPQAVPSPPPKVTAEDREKARAIRAQFAASKQAATSKAKASVIQVSPPSTTPALESPKTPFQAERPHQASSATTTPRPQLSLADRERAAAIRQEALALKAAKAQVQAAAETKAAKVAPVGGGGVTAPHAAPALKVAEASASPEDAATVSNAQPVSMFTTLLFECLNLRCLSRLTLPSKGRRRPPPPRTKRLKSLWRSTSTLLRLNGTVSTYSDGSAWTC
jgi:hypothetical protein